MILLDDFDTFFATISTSWIIAYLLLVVLYVVAEWKIFTKAGKPGWAVLIPIYNVIVLLEIVGKPWYWIFLLIIPGINFIFIIWVTNLLSKSFGHDIGFTLGLIFFGFIFILILGLGDSRYVGPAGAEFN
jgi:hypothetical protein